MTRSPADLAADVRKRHLYLEGGHWYVIGHGELEEFEELVALAERVEVADERHRIDLAAVKGQRERAEAAEAEVARLNQEVVLQTGMADGFESIAEFYKAEVARLRDGLRHIGYEMPVEERNPDGDEQAAYSMQLYARALLADQDGAA